MGVVVGFRCHTCAPTGPSCVCVCACVRACVRVCVRVRVCVCVCLSELKVDLMNFIHTVSQKTRHQTLAHNFPNVNRFSKFFYLQAHW